jgi:hypothetical protein
MFDPRERIDRIYRELGVPPDDEDVLVRWERMRPKPEPEPRERKLDPAPATLAEIEELIAERVAAEHERMMAIVAEVIAIPEEWMPAAPPGPPGPPGTPGAPGKLPIVKLWQPESVSYEAQVVSYGGATYQALRDTAQVPGGSDWICLALAGRDAVTPEVRGTYKQDEQYKKLDIVALNGSSFIARRENPGSCPGPNWQALSLIGKRGPAGPKGDRGERGEQGPRGAEGEAGPIIASWQMDEANYTMRAVMSDGSLGSTINLRTMFERYHDEVR